jgi:hypothetical protein
VKSVEEAVEEESVQGFCTLVKKGFGEREGRRYISDVSKTSPRWCGFRIGMRHAGATIVDEQRGAAGSMVHVHDADM